MDSLALSKRQAYAQAWAEFLEDGRQRSEDGVQFIINIIDKGWSRVTNPGKLVGITFGGKLVWGYAPTAGDLGKWILEGWVRDVGSGGGNGSHCIGLCCVEL